MSLVRCTCVVALVADEGRHELEVRLADPDCGYVLHRLDAVLGEPAGT